MPGKRRLFLCCALLVGIVFSTLGPPLLAQDAPKVPKQDFTQLLQREANAGNPVAKQALANPQLFGAAFAKVQERANLPQGRFTDVLKWLSENKEEILQIIKLLAPLFLDDQPLVIGSPGNVYPIAEYGHTPSPAKVPATCPPGGCTAQPAAACPCPASGTPACPCPTVQHQHSYPATYRATGPVRAVLRPFARWRANRAARWGGGGCGCR